MELLLSAHHVGRRVLLRDGTITLILAYSHGMIKTPVDMHTRDGLIVMNKGAYTMSGFTDFDIVDVLPEEDL